jgi:hypothetical protein
VISRDVDVDAVGELADRHTVIEQHESCTTEQILDTLRMMFGTPPAGSSNSRCSTETHFQRAAGAELSVRLPLPLSAR